jgi:hypothetical protein
MVIEIPVILSLSACYSVSLSVACVVFFSLLMGGRNRRVIRVVPQKDREPTTFTVITGSTSLCEYA